MVTPEEKTMAIEGAKGGGLALGLSRCAFVHLVVIAVALVAGRLGLKKQALDATALVGR